MDGFVLEHSRLLPVPAPETVLPGVFTLATAARRLFALTLVARMPFLLVLQRLAVSTPKFVGSTHTHPPFVVVHIA